MRRTGKPQWHPMPGKVVVKAITEEQIGSLYIPVTSATSRVLGTIIAIGGDEDGGDLDYPVAVGDVVLFSQNSGVKCRVDRDEVIILRTAEILSRITWEPSEDDDG